MCITVKKLYLLPAHLTIYVLQAEAFAPARKLSANLYYIYHCCVYGEKLLMMDRGTV